MADATFLPPQPVWRIAVPVPLPRLFDYRPPAGHAPPAADVGKRVRVTFGSRELVGVVAGVNMVGDEQATGLRDAGPPLDAEPLLDLPDMARRRGMRIHIHLGESHSEAEWSETRTTDLADLWKS